MLLADVLFLAIVVYLGYRFIFNFLLPVVRTTHQVRKQFRQHFGDPGSTGSASSTSSTSSTSSRSTTSSTSSTSSTRSTNPSSGRTSNRSYKPSAEDYIEFEEVKK